MARKSKLAACKYCEKVMRTDNLKVHIEETHEKKLKKCDLCGESMRSTSIFRHKQFTCLALQNSIKNIDGLVPACSNVSNDSEVVEEQEFQINTKVRLVKYRDGSVKYFCDPIKAGEYYFVLNQATLVDSTGSNGKSSK